MTFISDYPLIDQSQINGQLMRRILSGDLQIVKMGRTQKFELWETTNFGIHLKEWNAKKTTANRSRRIPPMRPVTRDKVEKMRRDFNIPEILELASLTPR
jgi:hypothetical protein